jgi:hypothetical protein
MRKNKTARKTPHGASWHPTGTLNPMAVLTEAKVRDIRVDLMNGVSCTALAQAHGVTLRTIRAVHERTTWSHVE